MGFARLEHIMCTVEERGVINERTPSRTIREKITEDNIWYINNGRFGPWASLLRAALKHHSHSPGQASAWGTRSYYNTREANNNNRAEISSPAIVLAESVPASIKTSSQSATEQRNCGTAVGECVRACWMFVKDKRVRAPHWYRADVRVRYSPLA